MTSTVHALDTFSLRLPPFLLTDGLFHLFLRQIGGFIRPFRHQSLNPVERRVGEAGGDVLGCGLTVDSPASVLDVTPLPNNAAT